MQIEINGRALSDTQIAVLRRGYCVLHCGGPWTCSDLSYREWADLIDANMLRHEKSCLHPDADPDICWERYRVTRIGKAVVS